MAQVKRVLDVQESGAVAALRDLLWRLVDKDVAQALLVPLQTHPHEAPAPTLIKNRERLDKADPLAPVMRLNSAKIVGLLLAQESGKRLAAVMRPCELRALLELAKHDQVCLDDLIAISIDCLGSHDEDDYEQRAATWGDDAPTRESLRWSRRGQIAPYRFRRACQMCEQPFYDQADVVIGLFGQDVNRDVLIFMDADLAQQVGLGAEWSRPVAESNLTARQETIDDLLAQRHKTRRRLLDQVRQQTAALADLLSACTLCGACQEACPLTPLFEFEMDAYEDNTPGYVAARILDLSQRSASCVSCGMCEMACPVGLPLMIMTQGLAERV